MTSHASEKASVAVPVASPIEMSVDMIRRKVVTIRIEAQRGVSLNVLRTRDTTFYESFPKLFDAAADSSFPMKFLSLMLEQLQDLRENKTNLDAADAVVYTQLRETYIDPSFPPIVSDVSDVS